MYEYERYIYEDVYMTNNKLKLCKEFFKEFKRLPKTREVYKDFNIGKFIQHLKEDINSDLKLQVEEIFEQEIKVVKKTVKLSDEDKLDLCKEFFKAYQRLPKYSEEFKDFKIGGFIANVKRGQN